jgi:hypothetical protein
MFISPIYNTTKPATIVSLNNQLIYSPDSPIYTTISVDTPDGFTVTTTKNIYPVYPLYHTEIDSGLHDNYLAQKQMTEYLYDRILNKWLYKDELSYLLRYLKIENEVVSVVKSTEEAMKNKLSSNTRKDIEKKADFIEDNILSENKFKKLLIKICQRLGYKYYDLADKEAIVVEMAGRNIKKKIKQIMSGMDEI